MQYIESFKFFKLNNWSGELMVSIYSYLETCLSANPELKEAIFEIYRENNDYLSYLDKLFEELVKGSVKSIDVKVSETRIKKVDNDDPLFYFNSLLSELEFARFFVCSKMDVQLLSYDAFKGRKVPDMIVKTSEKKYFVEVKNIQLDDEDHDFGLKVAEVLNKKDLKFMLIITSAGKLSVSAYMHNSLEEKEKLTQQAIVEFEEKLEKVSLASKPITIITDIADIELHKTKKDKSYLGIGTMKEAISQPGEYVKRIKYDLTNKCKKRFDWVDDELNNPYIIAIDDESWLFSIDTYNQQFYGNATSTTVLENGEFTVVPIEEKQIKELFDDTVNDAIKKGWKDYLIKMCILPNQDTVIPKDKRGLFFNEPLTMNATAVIVRRHSGKFYLLANPFAEEKINNFAVLQDFRNCNIGWEP